MVNRPPPIPGAFRQRVYEIVRLIPYGQVATYGFIATVAGMPRHARQVGWALHTLPPELVWGAEEDPRRRTPGAPPVKPVPHGTSAGPGARSAPVPWHRVINGQGRVSTHPDEYGTRRQIELLRQEGIEVADDGTLVDGLAAHRWRPNPAVVDDLELPAEALYALDQHLDD